MAEGRRLREITLAQGEALVGGFMNMMKIKINININIKIKINININIVIMNGVEKCF